VPAPAPAAYQENDLPDIVVPDETNSTNMDEEMSNTSQNMDEEMPNSAQNMDEEMSNTSNTTIKNLTPPNVGEDETKPNTSINTNSKTEGVNITRNGNLKNTLKRNTQGTTPLLRGGRLYSRLTKRNRKKRSLKRKN